MKTGDTRDRSSRHVSPKRIVSVVIPGKKVPTIVHWSFLLFVVTLPFEAADLSFTSNSLSLAKLAGLLFFACYFFYHNPFLSKRSSFPYPPTAFWWFLAYITIYTLNGSFISEEFFRPYLGRLFTLIQVMALFWIASSLLEEEKIARSATLTYSIASASLALGTILHLPGFSESSSGERVAAVGSDANTLGALMALAAVMMIGLYLNTAFKHFAIKIAIAVLTFPLLVVIVNTGSRAGMGMFVIGCMAYLLPSKRRIVVMLSGLLGMVAMIYLVVNHPSSAERWQKAVEEGDLAGRGNIYSIAGDMIAERPLFGWQPVEFQRELGRRIGYRQSSRDAHNIFLHLFMEVGAVGTIPFLMGLWLCARAAWRARLGNLGMMPLACLLSMLAANMTHTYLIRKPFWLVLSLTLAAASIAAQEQRKHRGILLVRKPLRSGV